METQPTFIIRNNPQINSKISIDVLNLIDYIIRLDANNRIIPNSLLYNLAVKQYNETITNTSTRPPVPEWFCGKIDEQSGLLLVDSDENIRASTGVSTSTTTTFIAPSNVSTQYPVDSCLSNGTPGSFGYSQCEITTPEDRDVLDWSNYVYTIATPVHQEWHASDTFSRAIDFITNPVGTLLKRLF